MKTYTILAILINLFNMLFYIIIFFYLNCHNWKYRLMAEDDFLKTDMFKDIRQLINLID